MRTALVRSWQLFFYRLRRDRACQELDEELETHRLMKQEELRRRGLAAERATALSRKEMGNMTVAKEDCRNMWSFLSLERLLQDLRFALRIFERAPVFTAVAVVSLAMGIGGNAAMFSLVNGLLVRPLPYRAPEHLVRITGIYPRAAVPFFQQQSRAMDIAAVSTGSELNLTGQGTAIRVTGSSVSCNFLDVLGISVARGRGFKTGEDVPGRDAIVVISDSLWKQKFGRNPGVLGRSIFLNGISREIVGVMPSGFSYPSAKVELWIPMRVDPSNFFEYWAGEFVPLVARLRPGASWAEAQGETRRLTSQFRKTFPYPMARDWNANSSVIPLQRDVVGDVRGKLIILLAAVGMVLLIACANVASLLLSRATTRRKEIALRASLGASRLRIVRQLLTESTALAFLGAAFGIALGKGALIIFKAVLPPSLPGLMEATMDWQVVGSVSILALVTGLAFGLAPALSASQVDLTETIKTGSQRSTAGFWTRFRSSLIVAEVAATLVLAVSAGLLLRSLYELSGTDPGFNPAHVLAVQVSPNQTYCKQRSACIALYDRLITGAREISGVDAAAISNSVPLDGDLPTIPVDMPDHPKTVDHPAPMLWFGAVSPEYFEMLHIPLIAGRYLTRVDGANSAPVAVISTATARHFWPGENPIGKQIKPSTSRFWRTVVGVVGDTHQYTLSTALPSWVEGQIYMPYAQSEREDGQIPAAMTLVLKSQSDTGWLRNEIHRLAQGVDPDVPVSRLRPLDEIVAGSIADFRATMRVFLSFAAVAIVLAAIGIYGLMSYWVSQRTYEIGLRVSIGATRQRIVSMIFVEGLRLSGFGIVLGIVVALVLTRFIRSLLYDVAAYDMLTFAGVILLVLCASVIATAFPAWKAARIDPVRSLRAE
ncbi:MAG: ABC transporter permease [Acidobacteriaceae bacterium]|nr:ABC transporter permease [Acidobacteriaceae bacterium]